MTTKIRLAVTAAALLTSLSLAHAQMSRDHDDRHPPAPALGMPRMDSGPGTAMGGQGMMAMMRMMHDGMTMPMGMGANAMGPFAHLDGQLAYWRAELHIADAQAPVWDTFAAAVRDAACKWRPAMMTAMQAKGELTALDRLDRHIAFLSAQADAMRSIQAAAKPLYDALSAEQKKAADELMAEHMHGMRARGL